MAYTRDIALHDKIIIDGTDVSNAFRTFGFTSDGNLIDVSGFSASGKDQNLIGNKAEQLAGDAFYTPESYALLWPLHTNSTIFELIWQPEGLIDNAREVYVANVQMPNFDPNATRGDVRVMACIFNPADDLGIHIGTPS